MIYKGYELSQSLNGDKIVYIARNAVGVVIFREGSEDSLKKTIDEAIEERARQLDQEMKQAQARKTARSRRKLFSNKLEKEIVEKPKEKPPQQTRRSSDGKFISRSQNDEETRIKKSIWEKLKG